MLRSIMTSDVMLTDRLACLALAVPQAVAQHRDNRRRLSSPAQLAGLMFWLMPAGSGSVAAQTIPSAV
jgi:hypothetical protein